MHDWALSARIRARVSVPVYLAGGLRAENVAQAVATVRQFSLSLCSDGRLDAANLARFVAALRQRNAQSR